MDYFLVSIVYDTTLYEKYEYLQNLVSCRDRLESVLTDSHMWLFYLICIINFDKLQVSYNEWF